MAPRIKVDYDAMENLFTVFADEVDTLKAQNSKLDSFIEGEIRSSWKGLAANVFFEKWGGIRENLQKLYKALELGEQNGLKILQSFHEAEEKAKGHIHKQPTDIFENRK